MASRDLIVHLIGDDDSLRRAYKRSTDETKKFERQMGQTFRGAAAGSGAFKSLGRSIAFASGAFLGGAGLVSTTKAAVEAASNLSEQTNKINTVFGQSGRTVGQWARTTATGLGIANDQALEAAGTFGNLFRTVGLAGDKNAQLSMSLVKLAADLASFNNASPEDTLQALRSGLIGEAEPLRQFGVLLSEARVQQEAMRETGKTNTKDLTDQEKVLARYNLILKDTVPAQGDFAKTQDGLANSTRQLQALIRDTEATIGKALLPTVRKITIGLRDWLGNTKNQQQIQRQVNQTVRDATQVVKGLADVFRVLRTVFGGYAELLGGTRNLTIALSAAFVVLKTRALLAAAGVNKLSASLKKLPARVGVQIAIAATVYGPLKKLFEQAFGANFSGITEGGGEERGGRSQARAVRQARALRRAGNSNQAIFAALLRAGFNETEAQTAINQITRTGEDVRLGAGTGTFTGGGGGGGGRSRLSLQGQLNLLETRLARALTTLGKADDRALLVQEKHLINRMISNTKDWQKRRQLYQQLAGVQGQIAEIDKDAADKEKQAKDKELAAEKKRLENHRAHIRAMRQAWQEQLAKIREAAEQVRGEFGALPFQATPTGILGVTGQTAGGFVAAYRTQTRTFVGFYKDLGRLFKRGAPAGLVNQLRGLGVEGAPLVHALATHPGQLRALIRSYQQREQVVQQVAKADINVRFANIHLSGSRAGATSSTQRRGQRAGVPSFPGPVVG